jgi:PhnB protein
MPRITPYLLYEDVESMLAWLNSAFGLQERMRLPGPDGRASHAEMALQDGVVMMGRPGPEYRNPKRTGHVAQELYVYVDDVDAHYARARREGATILEEPTDQFYGDRRYRVADPEGHHWCFATHVRDVSAEEMKAPT